MADPQTTTAVPQDLLGRIADAGRTGGPTSGAGRTRDARAGPRSKTHDVEQLLEDAGIGYEYKPKSYADLWTLDRCLTSDEHTDGAAILQFPSGAVDYTCRHASCASQGWKEAKKALGLGHKEESDAGASDEDGADRVFTFITIEDLRNLPQPSWLIQKVLKQATLAMLVGDFGSYKSFIALAWALSLAAGRDWVGRPVKTGAVAIVAAEGASGIVDRCDAWATHERCVLPATLRILGESIDLVGDNQAVIDALAAIDDLVLVIIDTVARTFHGNENLQEDANAYVAAADRIKTETGAAVLLVHHNNKQGEYRGSTVIPAAVDTMIGIERSTAGVVLTCLKQKDAEPFDPIHLQKVTVDLGPVPNLSDDAEIDVRSSLVFVPVGTEPTDRDGIDLLNPSERKALQALVDSPQTWLSWSNWQPITDIRSKGAFSKTVTSLLASGWVEKEEQGRASYYRATSAGEAALEGRQDNPFGPGREPTPGDAETGEEASQTGRKAA